MPPVVSWNGRRNEEPTYQGSNTECFSEILVSAAGYGAVRGRARAEASGYASQRQYWNGLPPAVSDR